MLLVSHLRRICRFSPLHLSIWVTHTHSPYPRRRQRNLLSFPSNPLNKKFHSFESDWRSQSVTVPLLLSFHTSSSASADPHAQFSWSSPFKDNRQKKRKGSGKNSLFIQQPVLTFLSTARSWHLESLEIRLPPLRYSAWCNVPAKILAIQ